jgi:hypothetical protein
MLVLISHVPCLALVQEHPYLPLSKALLLPLAVRPLKLKLMQLPVAPLVPIVLGNLLVQLTACMELIGLTLLLAGQNVQLQ